MTMLGLPRWPLAVTITPWSRESIGTALAFAGTSNFLDAMGSIAATANMCVFIPFVLNEPVTIQRIHLATGSVTAGNVDVGIYDEDGRRLVSAGSTAATGSTVMGFDITDTRLGPGRFYLAFVANNAGVGVIAGTAGATAAYIDATGIRWQSGTFPLPAQATFEGASAAINFVPLIAAVARAF